MKIFITESLDIIICGALTKAIFKIINFQYLNGFALFIKGNFSLLSNLHLM
jgi:hypothetical protein